MVRQLAFLACLLMLVATVLWWPLDRLLFADSEFVDAFGALRGRAVVLEVAGLALFGTMKPHAKWTPVLAVVNGDVGFTLTPAPETVVETLSDDAFRIDLPEPANESAPGLFDVTFAEPVHQGGATRPLINEDYIRRLVREDEMADLGGDFAFETPTEQARIQGLPLLGLGLGGMALFAGGVAWGLNANGGEGLLNPLVISWGAGLIGIVMAGFAAWRWLDGLAGAPFDDEDEAEAAEEDGERAQA
jgi:hypothetical protein